MVLRFPGTKMGPRAEEGEARGPGKAPARGQQGQLF